MRRIRLSELEPSDLISIILASAAAGRYVASLVSEDRDRLASYTLVHGADAVCLRVPRLLEDGAVAGHLLVWHQSIRHPVHVDTMLMPRDAAELSLLAAAAVSARPARILRPPRGTGRAA